MLISCYKYHEIVTDFANLLPEFTGTISEFIHLREKKLLRNLGYISK